ncbi:hypothetical protein H1P_2280003 [Hyella patelloides LEGE 07179]|uniref:Uncharacterized protein n=1 Tax=Hyella patelloides LEGE 07179 TaxID=945734 RepID=A0A563VRL4_9CYAN|nr:hypothetical protein H1P_2280003 [Hyella patelloides LEGE 07179]
MFKLTGVTPSYKPSSLLTFKKWYKVQVSKLCIAFLKWMIDKVAPD